MPAEETHAALVRFYDALARRDAETMAAMYAPDARFEDAVFKLRGEEIGRMWRGLLGRARDYSVTYTIAQAGPDRGSVEWTARYLFGGRRPRKVVNVILSELRSRTAGSSSSGTSSTSAGGRLRRSGHRDVCSDASAGFSGRWGGRRDADWGSDRLRHPERDYAVTLSTPFTQSS